MQARLTDYSIHNDSIHGHMRFHPLITAIIRTPQFQRLRDIKQLELTYFVYPSASHNRYEHSLGTCYLAGLLMDNLNQDTRIPEFEKEKLCVEIAALCHDLGHGPFSHLWQRFLNKCHPEDEKKWKHEENSTKIFDLILKEELIDKKFKKQKMDYNQNDQNSVGSERDNKRYTIEDLFETYGLFNKDRELIKDLINGKKAASLKENEKDKHYLYQIVNNADNDIDVDKFEYLTRDSRMLNLSVHFDAHRIIKLCRIAEAGDEGKKTKQICFREKVCTNIADMFMARGALFDKAYNHPRVQLITEMVMDAFYCARESKLNGYNLTSTKAEDIVRLTDHIFYVILNAKAEDENLKKAQHLLNRVLKKDIYKLIETYVIEHKVPIINDQKQKLSSAIYKQLNKEKDFCKGLQEKDIGTNFVEIGSGSNKTQPLENVFTYKAEDPNMIEKYNWNKKEPALMPVLDKYLKRKVFIMYKGEDQDIEEKLYKVKGKIVEFLDKELSEENCKKIGENAKTT